MELKYDVVSSNVACVVSVCRLEVELIIEVPKAPALDKTSVTTTVRGSASAAIDKECLLARGQCRPISCKFLIELFQLGRRLASMRDALQVSLIAMSFGVEILPAGLQVLLS